MNHRSLSDRIDALCLDASEQVQDPEARLAIAKVRERLHDPLRVAIAGRVKAGKSTLLNALVGERVAPTDFSECTLAVTWYLYGQHYDVLGHLAGGATQPLHFTREAGALSFELPPGGAANLDHVEVRWPSSRLQNMTLIDTPGVGSTDDDVAARTAAFFGLEDSESAEADAVIYLLRHVHVSDAEFLEAFHDRRIANGSPVNAVGVLSRADEIGAGRLDALVSARRVAARYGNDPRLRPLFSGCVAVAGLIAETAASFQEQEAASLRRLAETDPGELSNMLVSADRFLASESSDLTVEIRANLLERLGMFGVRFAIRCIQEADARSAVELSQALLAVSGLTDLRLLLEGQFAARAGLLKSRSALAALKTIGQTLSQTDPAAGASLRGSVEELESSAHELAELRLLHMLRSGALAFQEQDESVIETLLTGSSLEARLGFEAGSSPELLTSFVLRAISRWRERGANPVNDREMSFACETMARTYEGIYASLPG